MHSQTGRGAGKLWAITCYFNPVGYKRRAENYQIFRQHLTVPLVTVELSFDGEFQLRPGDADILVQLQGRDVLWQKERLLNIALEAVPSCSDRIAWLDCDILFDSDDWAERASRALDHCALLHLFHERCDLPMDLPLDQRRSSDLPPTAWSTVHKIATRTATLEDLWGLNGVLKLRSAPGLAWASPREVLARHGLYDACIVGSGDLAILSAALGEFEAAVRAQRMNARRAEHYLAWARPYFETVRDRLGLIEGRVFHLWHGDLRDRGYGERHRGLEEFDLDPSADLAVDANGCWRWNSEKKELHEFVRRYFKSRNEDGAAR